MLFTANNQAYFFLVFFPLSPPQAIPLEALFPPDNAPFPYSFCLKLGQKLFFHSQNQATFALRATVARGCLFFFYKGKKIFNVRIYFFIKFLNNYAKTLFLITNQAGINDN